jgi:transposase
MKVGMHTYLYEVTAYRDQNGKPRNRKHPIGKVDPATGENIYKPEYISKMAEAGTPVIVPEPSGRPKVFTEEQVKRSSIKEYGAYCFMQLIADSIGLKKILSESAPKYWSEIFTLASYMICSEDPFMYCSHWIASTETLPVGNMSSQKVSELLHLITEEERSRFFRNWGHHRREMEYLALDITSISSWSELIDDVEWGYNRDHEALPQINLCMLMGEKSRLPVYQTIYSGSLKDVSTLNTTLERARQYIGDETLLIVMDKGFYSRKNVDAMLSDSEKYQFIIPMPFTSNFAKNQIKSEKKDIDSVLNTIVSGKDSLRAVTKMRAWGNEKSMYVHIYFNARKAYSRREELYAHVASLAQSAREDPANKDHQKEFGKYLIIRASSKNSSGHTVSIREEVIEKELETSGWLVLLSNHVSDAKEAIDLYRAKDVVEKGFLRLKNSIDLGRLRIHSNESMQNKAFIGFISLILLSHINKIMLENEKELYKKMSMKEMIIILKKLRVQYIDGHRILFPLTKEHKLIFKAFTIPEPV